MDTSLFHLINKGFYNNTLDSIMIFITNRSYILFIGLLVPLFFKDRRKGMLVFVFAFLGFFAADGIGDFLKHIFARSRPCQIFHDIRLLVDCGSSFSFPSNHAATSFAAASIIGHYIRRAAVPAFLIAVFVAISRIYVGVHFPSDVAGGAVIGGLTGGLIIYMRQCRLDQPG